MNSKENNGFKIVEPKCLVVSKSKLSGDVTVSGAKNSVLRLLAASLLTTERVELFNYPDTLLDVQIHQQMLIKLGKKCTVTEKYLLIEDTGQIISELEWEGRSIRNTLLILGALVARSGYGAVPLPGGCNIGNSGDRGYDLHVMLLEKLGARVWEEGGMLRAEANGGLTGADIFLPIRSTGATENAIIASSLAKGKTIIWNPHIRPEILDLIKFINKLGANVEVFGQERIEVTGASNLGAVTHRIIPDNVEALTWLVGAVLTGGEIEIHDFPFGHLEVPLIFLRESGARMFRGAESLVIRGGHCYPLEISTGPYPGINSDMQPLLAVYGSKGKGLSKFIDLRFPGRYGYAEELTKMGMDCKIEGNLLMINGGKSLTGAEVKALDLRAGIALTLAGLIAEGDTLVNDAWQIARGYDRFAEKCQSLGAKVEWQI